jgi:hypothetical protein
MRLGCLFLSRLRFLIGWLIALFFRFIGVSSIIARDISIATSSSIDFNWFFFVKVTFLSDDLVLLLLLLLIASIRIRCLFSRGNDLRLIFISSSVFIIVEFDL